MTKKTNSYSSEDNVPIITDDFNLPSPKEAIEVGAHRKEIADLGGKEINTKNICGLTKPELEFMCDVSKLSYIGKEAKPEDLKKQGFSSIEEWENKGYKVKSIEDKNMKTKCAILYKENTDEVYISFRGTKNVQNVATDLNFGLTSSSFMDGMVHSGFYNAFKGLWPQVRENLDSIAQAQGKTTSDLKYNFTGHSMGGAVSKIAAYYVHKEYDVQPHNIRVTTFGDPRVFDTKQAREYDKHLGKYTVRFSQEKDIIPKVSPGITGYKHVGSQINLSSDAKSMPHGLKYYMTGLKALNDDGLVANTSVSFFHRPIRLIQQLREKIAYIAKPIADELKKKLNHEGWNIKENKNRIAHNNHRTKTNTSRQK